MDTPDIGSRILARLLILDVTSFNTPLYQNAAWAMCIEMQRQCPPARGKGAGAGGFTGDYTIATRGVSLVSAVLLRAFAPAMSSARRSRTCSWSEKLALGTIENTSHRTTHLRRGRV